MKDPTRSIDRVSLCFLGRGLAGALVGMLLLSNPFLSGRALAALFAGAIVIEGVLAFLAARTLHREGAGGRELAFVSAVDLVSAALALAFPAALSLRVIAGLRGLLVGGADALWARRLMSNELFTLGAVAAFGTGLLLLAWPGPATTALPWLLALATTVPAALFVAGALSEIRRQRDICALLHDAS